MDTDNVNATQRRLLTEERGKEYGHPTANQARIARLWNAYLANRGQEAGPLTGVDVCMMNILQKIGRAQNPEMPYPTLDTIEDIAGYAELINIMRPDTPPRSWQPGSTNNLVLGKERPAFDGAGE